jgi:hypothetical protein
MAKMAFDITSDDGETTRVLAGQADLIAMERKFDVAISALNENARMEYISYVAWHAAKRYKMTELDFDAWLQTHELETLGDQGNE